MKQLLQSLRTGETTIAEVPAPAVRPGELLIRSSCTLVSAGTERMLLEFGKAGWIDKARQQPEKVKLVLDKIRTDGLMPTVETVLNKLDQPLSVGYCNVGTVLEVGEGVTDFAVGDRVASNGKHAGVVRVPINLCAKVPDNVPDHHAVFTVIGAIGLQGVRLAQPTLGEAVVVTGLGLIGLVTVQLLRAHGCRVMGIDYDADRLAMARRFGAEIVDLSRDEDPLTAAKAFSRGRGVDAVIITASTKSNEPVHQAAEICRQRGRIVLVGVSGLELSRADFYAKELSFQVSCSYGPGRYDPNYEEKGVDYPVGFVRWTEQRNFEAVLDMISDKRIEVEPLISHRISIDDADRAYAIVAGAEPSLGIVLEYPGVDSISNADVRRSTVQLRAGGARATAPAGKSVVAFIGSGNYATSVLIPAFARAGASLRTVASSEGVSGVHAGRKFGFDQTTTDTASVFSDSGVNTVVVTTRHDSHARLVSQALRAGKHVFVEKPLALTIAELGEIESAYETAEQRSASGPARGAPLLMVGFNRRFAPHVRRMRSLLDSIREPKAFVMTVNAGALPPDHWTHDRTVGGGRIIGEGCHFIDLLRFLAGAAITGVQAVSMGASTGLAVTEDKASITLHFADGSLGAIHYLANGHKSYPKERLEVFCAGRILLLDNYRKLSGYGWPGFREMKLWRQDKGQAECAAAFVRAVEAGGASPIPFDELMEVSRVTIEAGEQLR